MSRKGTFWGVLISHWRGHDPADPPPSGYQRPSKSKKRRGKTSIENIAQQPSEKRSRKTSLEDVKTFESLYRHIKRERFYRLFIINYNKLLGGGGGATPKNPFFIQNSKMGFFNVGFFGFFWGSI